MTDAPDAPAAPPDDDSGAPPPLSAPAAPPPAAPDVSPYAWLPDEDDDEEAAGPPARDHHVIAVLVSHEGSRWLPATLTTVAGLTRRPDVLVGVDTGSTDDSATMLRTSFGEDRVTTAARDAGFGAAVAAGVAHADARVDAGLAPPPGDDTVRWVWLLHDDSAPAPDALEQLLRTSDAAPSAAVLGPKVAGWHDRRLLLECGLTVSGSGRRTTGLERGEHDQGQHDAVRDVLAVGSPGMLVRRDVWDALGGFDPRLPMFRDDLDLGWRANEAGHRVLVAPGAVVYHAEAGARGRRPLAAVPGRPYRADRAAALYSSLVHAGGWMVVPATLRVAVGTLLRALGALLAKAPRDAGDELAALVTVLAHPGRVLAGRRLVAATRARAPREISHLRPPPGASVRHAFEAAGGVLATGGGAGATSALESGPVAEDAEALVDDSGRWARWLRRPGVLGTLGLLLVALVGWRTLLGSGRLQGGALLPAPDGAGDLWSAYLAGWHEVGLGAATPAPPYLAALGGAATLLLGSAPRAVDALLLLSIPLAGLSAYLAMRGVVRGTAVRLLAAVTYALLPAATGAVAGGRLGTAALLVLLPPLLRVAVRVPTSWRAAWGGSLLLALVVAFAPLVWPVAVVCGVAAVAVVARRLDAAGRLAAFLLTPLLLLAPWTGYVAAHPQLLLLEPGLPGPVDPALRPYHVLLLHPGGPGMTPVWVSLGVLLAALGALLRSSTRRRVLAAWALAAVALLAGLLATLVTVTPPTGTEAAHPWPGPATALVGAAFLLAAAIGADGALRALSSASFSWRQPAAAAVVVLVALGPAVAAVAWVWGGVPGPITRADPAVVPAYVADDSRGPARPRTLLLAPADDGSVRYTLVTGAGPTLGNAETGPPGDAYADLDPVVGDLVAGRGGTEVDVLGTYAVRYVVLPPPADPALVRVLDTEPGLRRLSGGEGETLWRLDTPSARVRIEGPGASVVPVPAVIDSRVTEVDTDVAAASGQRRVFVAESDDPGWRAALDGTALTPGEGSWAATFALPQGAGRLTVDYDDGPRARWMWWQLAVFVVVVVLALPGRRRPEEDPDADVLGAEPVPATAGAPVDAGWVPTAADPRAALGALADPPADAAPAGVAPAESPAEEQGDRG